MKNLSLFLFLAIVMVSACKSNTETKGKSPTTGESTSPAALTAEETAKFVTKGKNIAKASFMALSGNLKKAMKAGGPTKAVEFCNLKASVLVDSLMTAQHATIKRTTDKLRSPGNKATEAEKIQLKVYMKQIVDNQPLKPVVIPLDGERVQFFAPIKMKAVCLKCHGTVGKTTKKKDYEFIKNLYPKDQAMDYVEGQFRGIWSIQFDRK